MRSHLLHLIVYASLVALFFGVLLRRDARHQLRLGAILWVSMVAGGLGLAYLMFPFPR